eukprot:2150248-Pyramimonas_sp.AAC.2
MGSALSQVSVVTSKNSNNNACGFARNQRCGARLAQRGVVLHHRVDEQIDVSRSYTFSQTCMPLCLYVHSIGCVC